ARPERDDWCALLRRGDHDLLISTAALTNRPRPTRRSRRVRIGTAGGGLAPAARRILQRTDDFVDVGANVRVPIHARSVAAHQRGHYADAEATSMIALLDI
ncbi:MAG: hypothetical protein JWQ57_2558, partial [Mucilaginibacter sp.]|nr:hypothetical protein [Mucilaginibacter sp.]